MPENFVKDMIETIGDGCIEAAKGLGLFMIPIYGEKMMYITEREESGSPLEAAYATAVCALGKYGLIGAGIYSLLD